MGSAIQGKLCYLPDYRITCGATSYEVVELVAQHCCTVVERVTLLVKPSRVQQVFFAVSRYRKRFYVVQRSRAAKQRDRDMKNIYCRSLLLWRLVFSFHSDSTSHYPMKTILLYFAHEMAHRYNSRSEMGKLYAQGRFLSDARRLKDALSYCTGISYWPSTSTWYWRTTM